MEALFMQRVENRIPPDLNGSDTCKELIGRLYKKPNDTFNELEDDEFAGWIEHRAILKDHLDTIEKEYKERTKVIEEEITFLENQMKHKIANDKGVIVQGWKVTWGERSGRKSADIKLLEEKYPEIAAEVIKQGEGYRQLSFAKPKTKKGVKA
jgi:predicted phage-related endonuclease